MSETLLNGDFILVNKFNYGPRLPFTPLTLPFSHKSLPFNLNYKAYLDWIQLPYYRFPGFEKIKRGDIIVFNYPLDISPIDHKTQFVKRCVALAGDTLKIERKKIIINDSIQKKPKNSSYNYIIKPKNSDFNWKVLDSLNITEGRSVNKNDLWQLTLSYSQLEKIKTHKAIDTVYSDAGMNENFFNAIFPYHPHFSWTIDDFGPLIIPKKGNSININDKNIVLYQKIISEYEENHIDIIDSHIIINGEEVSSYTFKSDYYFVVGDNWDNSSDSRLWGFVPESHIIGKTSVIIFSLNKSENSIWNKIRWKRILKKIS